MSININDIKITIKLIREPKNVLARATVVFDEVIEIHGFTVSRSQMQHPKFMDFLWIQPPKVHVFGLWTKIVFINDPGLWSELEEKIYDAYCIARTRNPITETDKSEENVVLSEKEMEEIDNMGKEKSQKTNL